MANDQGSGLSTLGASIRSIIHRLNPLETASKAHEADIEALKIRAAAADAELIRLTKIAQQQGTELAGNQADIAELKRSVDNLESEIEGKADDIHGLKSALHGERVKRGLANAKVEKMERVTKRRGR
jgi:chromosome segregation ATPase